MLFGQMCNSLHCCKIFCGCMLIKQQNLLCSTCSTVRTDLERIREYILTANCWRYLRENLDIIDKILLKFLTTKLHSLICYSTHYKMDIYHEWTSEQVSMGSECEVGSTCYSKHDGGELQAETGNGRKISSWTRLPNRKK